MAKKGKKSGGDLKQKLKDLQLLLKEDRKAQVIAVCLFLAVFYVMTADDSKKKRRRFGNSAAYESVESEELGSAVTAESESYKDLITAFNVELKELKKEQGTIVSQLNDRRKETEEYEARVAEIFKRILERMADQEVRAAEAGMGGIVDPGSGMLSPIEIVDSEEQGEIAYEQADGAYAAAPVPDEQLEAFGAIGDESAVAPPLLPEEVKTAIIGTGDNVRIKLIAGVNAPTDGTPYPVLFKLTGNVIGPDGSSLPLGEARLIAAAQGSLSDSRAIFRLTDLSIRMPNGSREIVPVDGWVVGEDGLRGMLGILIDPIGKHIAGAAIGGGVAGIGQALTQAQQTTVQGEFGLQQVFTGNQAEFAAGQAITGAAGQWNQIIQGRLQQLTPQVQVKSGRTATAIFSAPVAVPGLFEQLEDQEVNAFASLD